MTETSLIIGWVITILIAVVGWGIAIIQAVKNRDLQKSIEQKKMRHEAYRAFVKEMDAVSQEISIMPVKSVMLTMSKCMSDLVAIDDKAPNHAELEARCISKMYEETWQVIEGIIKPLKHISQAISALEMDATDELMPMLVELKNVVMYIDDDWQKALEAAPQNNDGLQQLAELARSDMWARYQKLYNQILQQMRKECAI